MNVPNSMQAGASPAWEFGNPCRRRRYLHGNLGIHAGGGVTCMGIWESMQAAGSAAWEFGNPCRRRRQPHGNLEIYADGGVSRMEISNCMQVAASPAWRSREFRYISRQTAGQNGKICRSPNKFEQAAVTPS